ncbi:hypothetical protein BKA62DRAFT_769958 [Auriculariales sp. MPI-PUGE-AT-0066]|nr:hypothetical protein BKA62DRAFT_769958 [Auriculariales sp. MPI-PUGE-AT-0066]
MSSHVGCTFNFAKGTLDKDRQRHFAYDAQTNAVATKPTAVKIGSTKLEFYWTDGTPAKGEKKGVASTLVIKDSKVCIVQDWSIVLESSRHYKM